MGYICMIICNENQCSACSMCINVCPQKAITLRKENLHDNYIAHIDDEKCIKCKICVNNCPQNVCIESKNILNCYAGWSLDKETRRKGASGGIASELYKWAISNGYWIDGVKLNNKFQAEHVLSNELNIISDFSNSKYQFSNMGSIYCTIEEKLIQGEKIIFIGLPCQVAGLKNYLKYKKLLNDNIVFVDLVCHGTAPEIYIQQHINYIEKKYNKSANKLFYRNPEFNTYTYTFTLSENEDVFYKKKVKRNDEYQIGYHKGIIYRENCYNCRYACTSREGDITLADFSYVGSKEVCNYDNKNVSCILINSKLGENVIKHLIDNNSIFGELRPIEEELDYEKMLHKPTERPKERKKFLAEYKKTNNYDLSIKRVMKYRIYIEEICDVLNLYPKINFVKRNFLKLGKCLKKSRK